MFDVITTLKKIHNIQIKNVSVNINESGQCALLSLYFHYIRHNNMSLTSNNFKKNVLSPWENLNNSSKVSRELNIAKKFKNKSIFKEIPMTPDKRINKTAKTIRKTVKTAKPLKTIRKTRKPMKTIKLPQTLRLRRTSRR